MLHSLTRSLAHYGRIGMASLARNPLAHSLDSTGNHALAHTDGFEALCQSVRLVHSARQNDSNSDSKPISSFDFDHINTIWESDDWDELHSFTRSSLAGTKNWTQAEIDQFERDYGKPSLSRTRSPSAPSTHSLISYRKHGGIHFIRIANWSMSASRKRVTRVKVDMEERLLRLLLPLVIWPALCIAVIQLMEAIGFGGR